MTATSTPPLKTFFPAAGRWLAAALFTAAGFLPPPDVWAQSTVCARVKIEIKQPLTLERQAFEAEMKINNTTDTGVIENVAVELKVTDENGNPVPVSGNSNDSSAKFFVRVSNKTNIAAIDGSGTVAPMTTSSISWLLIPAPGSAGLTALGKKYLVGATLKYKYGADQTVLDLVPGVITVKPLPLLSLDYFLPQDVTADDPLTPAIEAAEPFTLGVRVKNNGFATAKALKIDSAQPKIVENNQGLLINFLLTGSYVNDVPAQNSLLINFGDVPGGAAMMGRWDMETTLAGKFVEFTAKFSHSDELGGALTSILQATNAHALIHDVRVDLPGRDYVRDFLARDGDVLRVYESDGPDTVVSDRSGVATLVAGATENGTAQYRLSFPPTAGFSYVRLVDPFAGTKVPGKFMRSDAKQLSAENVWLSKTRNASTKQWEYWINLFDVNSSGEYDSQFQPPPAGARAPVMQLIADHVAQEGKQVSFLVEASSPDGKPLTFTAAPLPVGARLTPQAASAATPGLSRAIFDWTPAKGSVGNYLVTYTASDGSLSAVRSASIRIEAAKARPGPETPIPVTDFEVIYVDPLLSVRTANKAVQFEIYTDKAESKLLASTLVSTYQPIEGTETMGFWRLRSSLNNNTQYWWRARASDGTLVSPWAHASFYVNTFNEVPEQFNLASPAHGASVAVRTPSLAWTNSKDRDGNAITYSVAVYRDALLSQLLLQSPELPGEASGTTSWRVPAPLVDAPIYYWRVVATDALGAQTQTAVRTFTIDTTKVELAAPAPLSPPPGGRSATSTTTLSANGGANAYAAGQSYVFEIDTVNTFDSGNKRSSGPVARSNASSTSWNAANLVEDQRYWWRVKLLDSRGESAWVASDFLISAVNHAPPAPTVRNPGNGAWTPLLQPRLEANPVVDPEDDAVRYQFEIYKDAALTQRFGEGTSATSTLVTPTPLLDGATYWWRVRALDTAGASSAWSAAAALYVRTFPGQGPAITVTTPATKVVPELSGDRRTVTIRWEGPSLDTAMVGLYYSYVRDDYVGIQMVGDLVQEHGDGWPIVEGLRQEAGAQSGSHVWDVSALDPAVYYVYADIYDSNGVSRVYAPGTVIVPNRPQGGGLNISGPATWTEAAAATTTVTWSGGTEQGPAPLMSGNAVSTMTSITQLSPASGGSQSVSLSLPYQCNKEPLSFKTLVKLKGGADLDLAGLTASSGLGKVVYAPSNTGDESLRVCDIRIISERKLDSTYAEYTVSAKLSNLGAAIASATAAPVALATNVSVSGALAFSNIGAGDVANSRTTVLVRAPIGSPGAALILQKGLKWSVQLTR